MANMKETNKKRRCELTLKQKYELIMKFESEKISVRKLAQEFNIGRTQASAIIKKSDDFKRAFLFSHDGASKRVRSNFPTEELNNLMYAWFEGRRQNKMPVTGPSLQGKAMEVAKEIGIQTFKASNGWLESFKKRHSIKFKPVTSDNSSSFEKSTVSISFAPSYLKQSDEVSPFSESENVPNLLKVEKIEKLNQVDYKFDRKEDKIVSDEIPQTLINDAHCLMNSVNAVMDDYSTVSDDVRDTILVESNDWMKTLLEIINGYSPYDIFCLGEIGLLYRCLPFRELFFTSEMCTEEKIFKERLSIGLCCNQSGTELLTPLIVGRTEQPQGIRHFDTEKLPIMWHFNRKALITRDIFQDWIKNLDQHFRKTERHVLLFVDGSTAHISRLVLHNIRLVFIPPEKKSEFQPFSIGISQAFKLNYRKNILKKIISFDEMTHSFFKTIDELTACCFISTSWADINQETITNCFKKAGFPCASHSDIETQVSSDTVDEEFICLMSVIANSLRSADQIKPWHFFTVDEKLSSTEEFSENNIELDKKCDNLPTLQPIQIAEENNSVKSLSDAIAAVSNIKNFILDSNFPSSVLQAILAAERQLEEEKVKQTLLMESQSIE